MTEVKVLFSIPLAGFISKLKYRAERTALRVFCARVRYIRDNFHSLRSPSRSSSAPFAKYTRSLAIVPLTHNPDNSRLRKNVYTKSGGRSSMILRRRNRWVRKITRTFVTFLFEFASMRKSYSNSQDNKMHR